MRSSVCKMGKDAHSIGRIENGLPISQSHGFQYTRPRRFHRSAGRDVGLDN